MIISVTYCSFTIEIYELDTNMGCSYRSNYVWSLISTTLVISFSIWNWTIVGLYTFKLYQLRQKIIGQDEYSRRNIEKINLVLSKMLFLILIIQITGNLIAIYNIWCSKSQWQIEWAFDFITVISIMYLMLDHNQSDYYKFIGFFVKIRCIKYCCCCIESMIEEDKINEINQRNRRQNENESSTDLNEVETTTHALRINVDDDKQSDVDINVDGTVKCEITDNEIDSERTKMSGIKNVDWTESPKVLQIMTGYDKNDEYAVTEASTRL